MNKIDRFWSHEAQNIRCVREADYDRDVNAWQERALTAEAKQAQQGEPCDTCDGSGVVHRADGEWMGYCDCASGWLMKARSSRICAVQEEPHNQPARQAATHSEDGREADLRKVVTESLIGMVSSISGMTPPPNEPPPQFIQAAIDRAVDRISGVISHPPAPDIPEGYALVPVEPTPKMVDATWHHPIDQDGGIESQNTRNKRIYRAMIAAATQPTTEGSTDE